MRMMVVPVLLLLLVLWPAYLAAASVEKTFEDFKREHVDSLPEWEDDSSHYCNRMMLSRNITASKCKKVNTFIHEKLKEIVAVCDSKGTWYDENFYYSNSQFMITDCMLKSGFRPSSCKYKGVERKKSICLACIKKKPVHYALPSDCGGLKVVQGGF